MSDAIAEMHARAQRTHDVEVANGEHDDQCEFRPGGFYIGHCSRRKRHVEGFTTPPGELIWQYPLCPRCDAEVEHDGDVWTCEGCRVRWDLTGQTAEFDDEYGDDLAGDLAKWEAEHRAAEYLTERQDRSDEREV